jgi:AMP-binding enzyme
MDLPFTNIRQVLSLHNKVSPEKIFLTVISDQGREELTYGEFSARSHQTANFLQEDLGIQPGDIVTIFDDEPSNTAVLLMACWLVGAIVGFGVTKEDEENGRIKARFIRHHDEPYYENFGEIAKSKSLIDKPLIQLGGVPTEGYPHFDTLVRSMPNSFFNDHPEPTLNTPAFQSVDSNTKSIIFVTQGELLTAAEKLANSQAITGNQRLITCLPLTGYPHLNGTLDAISIFISSLLVGSSLIIDSQFIPMLQPDFWRVIAANRLHVVCLPRGNLATLVAYAKKEQIEGKPIYGAGVYQQDIKQLRHLYCAGGDDADEIIRQFTDIFPFPVITSSW